MATFTLKNIPDELFQRLRQAAEAHRRSINSEILTCLERSLGDRRIDPEELLARAHALRDRVSGAPLTFEEVQQAKISGRL